MKIDGEIIDGCLVIKDPRRGSEMDRQAQWMLLPALDPAGIVRGSDKSIAASHVVVSQQTRHFGCIISRNDDLAIPLRERRRDAMQNLHRLGALRTELETLIMENVNLARQLNSAFYDYGAPTWSDIGDALGVTKQAAQSRYGSKP